MIDENDKIQCQICKRWFKQITGSHLDLHGITVKEYKILYPKSHNLKTGKNMDKINRLSLDFLRGDF